MRPRIDITERKAIAKLRRKTKKSEPDKTEAHVETFREHYDKYQRENPGFHYAKKT